MATSLLEAHTRETTFRNCLAGPIRVGLTKELEQQLKVEQCWRKIAIEVSVDPDKR